MKNAVIYGVLAAMSLLAGCTTPPQVNAPVTVVQFQAELVKQCKIVSPFLTTLQGMQSQFNAAAQADLATAQKYTTAVCTAITAPAPVVDLPSVQDLVNKGVPALIRVVDQSGLNQDQKGAMELAIGGAQLIINQKLQNLQVTTVTTPATVTQ